SKLVKVAKGYYDLELEYHPKKNKLELKIKKAVNGKKDLKFNQKLPNTVKLPSHSGPIKVESEELGQPFDLVGFLKKDITYSPHRHDWESCTYQVKERVCERRCEVEDSHTHIHQKGKKTTTHHVERECHRQCDYEYVTHYGSREVEYRYRTQTLSLKADLLQPGSLVKIGDLEVGRRDVSKDYHYRGFCR
ncbi:MAG: hypothetical protein KDK66_09150, partial [Deltaproteobacteria bacterium]|nr:hypothetical protein [Deltaproteobacteria bacterium]